MRFAIARLDPTTSRTDHQKDQMTMSYPVLPMALVTFLAGVSKERSELPKGPIHVTTVIQHGPSFRPSRFAVQNDMHWSEVLEVTIQNYNAGGVDTVTLIYPSSDDEPVDFGIILEGGRKPFCFQWTYAPVFDIRLASDGIRDQITKGIGVATMQGLLDKDARLRQPGSAILADLGAVNQAFFAGTGDPDIAGSGAV